MRCKKGREETLICKLQKTHVWLTKYYLFSLLLFVQMVVFLL